MADHRIKQRLDAQLAKVWGFFCRAAIGKSLYPTERLGSDYGGWIFYPEELNPSSIVYSVGIGEDISFDLGLIKKYDCAVFAFDPTPRSIEWLKQQNLPARFKYFDYGVADYDGDAQFFSPENPDHISHSILKTQWNNSPGFITVNLKRLVTIMQSLNHRHIDILKMDIEGAEYETLKDMLSTNLDVRQILVEFHHFFPRVGLWKTILAVGRLYLSGYRLISISPNGHEYSFVRRRQ